MGTLSLKQQRILDFIQKFISSNGYPPTYQEISGKFNIIVGTVQDHISALVKKGYLEKTPEISRGLRVVNPAEKAEASKFRSNIDVLPLYGRVAAGEPIFADSNIQGYISYERKKRSSQELFALMVKGDSMKNAGIYENDIVIVRKQEDADEGEVVIALLDDEVTVKTLRKKKNRTYLEPANPKYKLITERQFSILGKVIELRRKYQIL